MNKGEKFFKNHDSDTKNTVKKYSEYFKGFSILKN